MGHEVKSAKEIAEERAKNLKEENLSEPQENKKIFEEKSQIPEITFASYILMLSALGWQFLGKVPNPTTGKIEKDLISAKEIIDILQILVEKTKNNLTFEEERILKDALTNLRLNYIDVYTKELDIKSQVKSCGKL